jgi:hypothetical protein
MNRQALVSDRKAQQDRITEQEISRMLSRASTYPIIQSFPDKQEDRALVPIPTNSHRAHYSLRESIAVSTDDQHQLVVLKRKLAMPVSTMHIMIDADSVTMLRHIVIETFGEMVEFIRIQATNHAKKMKVYLCLTAPIAGRVMETIMHALPNAEFGRITHS